MGNAFFDKRKKRALFVGEISSAVQEYDNIYCNDLRSDYARITAGNTKRVPEYCAKAGWDGRRESV